MRGGSGDGGGPCALLRVAPPLEHPVGSIPVTVRLTGKVGDEAVDVARTLQVLVLPNGGNRPPEVEAPAAVVLHDGRATFDVSATDPEGEPVTLTLAYPYAGQTSPGGSLEPVQPAEAGAEGKVQVWATRSFLAYVRATDPAGGRRLVPVQILTAADAEARGVDPAAASGRGITGALRDR